MASKTSKYSVKLQNIKERLEKLCCPFIEDGSEQWIAELLLHPSETRFKLLSWVVTNFDSDFDEVINSTLPVINSRIDSRQQKMLFVLNVMGVCKIDDIELVKGTSSQKKQLAFWDELVDMVYTSQTGHNFVLDMHDISPETSYYLKPVKAPSVSDTFHSSCTFVDTLVRENKMKDLFSTEVHLFSPDLEGKIKDEIKSQDVPSIDLLQTTAEKISEDISVMTKQLEGTLANFTPIEPDQNIIENYCRKIDLSLNTFSQMIDSFIHCYENDIEVWCKKEQPELSDLGPSVASTYNMLQGPQHLHKSLSSLNKSMSYMSTTLSQDARKLKSNSSVDESYLKEISEILQDSKERLKG